MSIFIVVQNVTVSVTTLTRSHTLTDWDS